MASANQNVIELKIEELSANPLQPRGLLTSESLSDLVSSIKEHGVLEPLIVAKTPVGYQIIAGERRWRAAKIAGHKTIPCLIKETTPKGMLEMALVENVQREDLNPIERALAFRRLINEFNLNPANIAQRIGKSIPYVSNTLRLLSLPDAVKDGLVSALITEGHARALAGIHNIKLMLEAYKLVLKNSYNVRSTEELARRANKSTVYQKSQKMAAQEAGVKDQEELFAEDTVKMQEILAKALAPAKIKIRRSSRETCLEITLKGNPEETEERIQKILRACQ